MKFTGEWWGRAWLVKVKISGKPGTSKRFLYPTSSDLKSKIFVPVIEKLKGNRSSSVRKGLYLCFLCKGYLQYSLIATF